MLSYNVLNSWVEKMMKKNLPVKIKTSNITTLSTKDINKLKAGDIVLKKTGNQKHAYIVSYKEDNQGICLTYSDASVIETVSYDYNTSTNAWVYNSTDVTPVQSKLTAGNNVQINNGVISATDTTYAAGTNITIEDGVISSTGGEIWENCVQVTFTNGNVLLYFISKEEITSNNVNTIIDAELDRRRMAVFICPTAVGTPLKDSSNNIVIPIVLSHFAQNYYIDILKNDNTLDSVYQSYITNTVIYSHKIN